MANPAGQDGVDFSKIFQEIPSPCLILAPDLTIVAVNNAYLEATLTQPARLLGSHLFDVFPDNPHDPESDGVANLRASLEKAGATRQPDTMRLQKYDIPLPEGGFAERYWSPINVPVLDDHGEVASFIHRVEDVTAFVCELKQVPDKMVTDATEGGCAEALAAEAFRRWQELDEVNERLRQANDALAQLDHTKSDFFNDVSHEFRTPLTLLLWSIEHLQDSADGLDEGQRKAVSVAKRNAARMLHLVNTLLDFARLESGRAKVTYRPTDLSSFTAEVANQFGPVLEQAGLRLIIDCPPLPEPVCVDREMWEKIVLNLVSNAFKFTLHGEVRVSLNAVAGCAELSVSDSGGGISESELPRVFERFYRAKGVKARSVEGTGIGLFIVRELARLHGGEVRVDSVHGQGSTFSVSIPFGRAHLAPASIAEDAAVAVPGQAGSYVEEAQLWLGETDDAVPSLEPDAGSRPRVLVVDDNVELGSAISSLLGQRFRTETITDGASALKSVYENAPDVLVTDLLMSGLGGLDLVRAIRTDPQLSSLSIIVVSGSANEDSRSIALEAGADDFLVKPFSARELLARLGILVDHAQRSRLERSLRAEAEAARARMRMVLESVSEAFVAVGRDWRITFANGRACEWLGKVGEDLIEKPLDEVLPQVSSELRVALQQAMDQRNQGQVEQLQGENYWRVGIYPSPEGIVLLARDITERKAAERRMSHLAHHDPLTGLPNRSLLYERGEDMLAGSRRSGDTLALLFFDLDRFKPINDTYGHNVGDQVLQEVARRIRGALRPEDWSARLGGDEFVALLPKPGSAQDVSRAASQALEALRQPFHIDGLELHSSSSIGISRFPENGNSIDDLIQNADAAMYLAKERGRNNFQFFTEALGQKTHAMLSIEGRLRSGVEANEFRLFYQPLINTLNGSLNGVEALLRWPQPDRSYISPETFIPIAEASGLIWQLGEWVHFEACRQHRVWQEQGLPPIRVAVNVSAVQLRHRDFQGSLQRTLAETKSDPNCLSLEVTESALMTDLDTSVRQLRELRSLGMQVALDDFGTGYSSLSQLTRLPLDKLKIDRSFVRNLGNGGANPAIVEAVIALGRTLNLEIVAEGVETVESLEFLRSHHCHQAQGFYFAPPMPAGDFAQWYRRRNAMLH